MPKPKPNPRNANGHRRRQLRQRVLAEEHTCGICGTHVDKTLPPHHPLAPEVDEIIPVSQGGDPLARGNVRLAHRQRICNQRRGDGRRDRQTAAHNRPPVTPSDIW